MNNREGHIKIAIATLFRDNETYIPFYLKCLKRMEEALPNAQFTYHWYTNNNADKTTRLLQDQKVINNAKLTVKDWSEEHLKSRRIVRLAIYREEQLQQLKKVDADYLLMIDTEVFFNGHMVESLLNALQKTNAAAVAPFTVNKFGFYHDTFAHVDLDGTYMKLTENTVKTLFKRHLWNNPPAIPYQVLSAFGGLFLAKKEILEAKNLTYLSDKPACEHLAFNGVLNQAGFKILLDNQITPIMCDEKDYAQYFSITSTNKADLRKEIMAFRNSFNITVKDMHNLFNRKAYKAKKRG